MVRASSRRPSQAAIDPSSIYRNEADPRELLDRQAPRSRKLDRRERRLCFQSVRPARLKGGGKEGAGSNGWQRLSEVVVVAQSFGISTCGGIMSAVVA
jgi:hypothetical protein